MNVVIKKRVCLCFRGGIAGQIEGLGGPDWVRGPRVGHPWSSRKFISMGLYDIGICGLLYSMVNFSAAVNGFPLLLYVEFCFKVFEMFLGCYPDECANAYSGLHFICPAVRMH